MDGRLKQEGGGWEDGGWMDGWKGETTLERETGE